MKEFAQSYSAHSKSIFGTQSKMPRIVEQSIGISVTYLKRRVINYYFIFQSYTHHNISDINFGGAK